MELEPPPRPEMPPTVVGPAPWHAVRVPPLLPVLLPLVVAAIVIGALFSWLFPPAPLNAVAPQPRFTDVTAEAGLNLSFEPATADEPTTLGGGVVAFDFDGDGHSDLLFINGTSWPWEEPLTKRISRGSLALFHNDGTGKFTDVTAIAGLNVELQGMTAAIGDFDNDGLPDIFVTCVGPNHLFRNRGHGRFEDVTEIAGVGGPENLWSTGATWIDLDNDGRLDLVVGHYARWARGTDLQMAFTVAQLGHSYGAPTGFIGAFPSVYRNLGDGRFELLPAGAGLHDVDRQTGFPTAKTLAVVPVDANGDGQLDLLFSYQNSENVLFLNRGDGTFRRSGRADERRAEGLAANFAAAGSQPFIQSSGSDDRYAAWQAAGVPELIHGEVAVLQLRSKLADALIDYDLDGRLDIFSGNGLAELDINRFENGRDFQAMPEIRWNAGNRWIQATPVHDVAPWNETMVARGIAVDDFDGDGRLDLVVAQHRGPPRLLHNDQRSGQAWLRVDLVGTRRTREGFGARVEVVTPTRTFVQTRAPAMGFMAQSGSTLTFGLGDDARVRKILIYWPSGVRQEIRQPGINRRLVITEP
jgi:hypothetical protein